MEITSAQFSMLLRLLAEILLTKIQHKHGPSTWTVLCLLLLPWASARDDAGKRSAPSTVWAAAGKQQRNSIFTILMWSYQNVLSDFFHPYPQRHFSVSQGITDGRPESAVWSCSPSCCGNAAFSFTVTSWWYLQSSPLLNTFTYSSVKVKSKISSVTYV